MNEELKKILDKMLREIAHQTDLMEEVLEKLDEICSNYSEYFVEDESEEEEEDYDDYDDEYGFYDPDEQENEDAE